MAVRTTVSGWGPVALKASNALSCAPVVPSASKPCKSKLVQLPSQEKSLQQQQVTGAICGLLDQVQLKQLCNRLLCGHGGVGLAKSMLDSGLCVSEQHESALPGVSVGTVRNGKSNRESLLPEEKVYHKV